MEICVTRLPAIDFDQLLDSDDTIYIVGTEDAQDELRPIFVGLIDTLIIGVGERMLDRDRVRSEPITFSNVASKQSASPKKFLKPSTTRPQSV